MTDPVVADTRRLNSKPQDLTDAYGPPSNFLEIDVYDPQIVGVGRNRYTTYEVRMRTNLPIFKLKDSCVRRRYSDFEWLKNELERDSKNCRSPLGPERALSSHVSSRGGHRPQLHSWKSMNEVSLLYFLLCLLRAFSKLKVAAWALLSPKAVVHRYFLKKIIIISY
uniref:PX domain-containing protein n=1 Tax=Oryzias latipes TaxID=8090 RepID=A0A3P9LCG6_ORYLA